MYVVTREEMQAVDRYTIQKIGLGGPILMENAGRAISAALAEILRPDDRIVVIIGKGNNGGDGFAAARLLLGRAVPAEIWLLPDSAAIGGDARIHMNAFLASGGTVRQIKEEPEHFAASLSRADWIIDALLGTGFHGTPYPDFRRVIGRMNQSRASVISIDLPSGVPADGEAFQKEAAVQADRTLTLQCPKLARFVPQSAAKFGRTQILDIGIPGKSFQSVAIRRDMRTKEDVLRSLPIRSPFSHKGSNGKGMIIAGSGMMPGAAFFAAKAALRSGIGLLSVSVPDSIRPIIAALLPETMYRSRQREDYQDLDGIAIGPGLGREPESAELLARVLAADIPCVIDADGLYHLKGMLGRLQSRKSPVILSPHSGEMARLIGRSVSEVEQDRFGVARDFAEKYGVYLVLKGKYTIISAPDGKQTVNATGNAALAKGGSGDVLTGILLAFLLQHRRAMDAACNAVYLHGAVADSLIQSTHSQLDVLASDVLEQIPPVLHRLYQEKNAMAPSGPSLVIE